MNTVLSKPGLCALSSFMDDIQKSGLYLDEHETELYDLFSGMMILRRHTFDGYVGMPRMILTHEQEPDDIDDSLIRISLADVWPDDLDMLLREVLEEYQYDVMFLVEEGRFELGPFFSFPSKLRDILLEALEGFATRQPYEIGPILWKKIELCGGLKCLRDHWESLFEERIKPEMLRIDPYCLDPK